MLDCAAHRAVFLIAALGAALATGDESCQHQDNLRVDNKASGLHLLQTNARHSKHSHGSHATHFEDSAGHRRHPVSALPFPEPSPQEKAAMNKHNSEQLAAFEKQMKEKMMQEQMEIRAKWAAQDRAAKDAEAKIKQKEDESWAKLAKLEEQLESRSQKRSKGSDQPISPGRAAILGEVETDMHKLFMMAGKEGDKVPIAATPPMEPARSAGVPAVPLLQTPGDIAVEHRGWIFTAMQRGGFSFSSFWILVAFACVVELVSLSIWGYNVQALGVAKMAEKLLPAAKMPSETRPLMKLSDERALNPTGKGGAADTAAY